MSAGEAVVVWTPPGGSERRCRFADRCEIGRSPQSRILLSSPSVSRDHAVLELTSDALLVRNVSAAAPIDVDGVPIGPGETRTVDAGATVRVAGVSLTVASIVLPRPTVGPTHIVCTEADCGREVPSGLADCPWCGTSTAFAHTSLGALDK